MNAAADWQGPPNPKANPPGDPWAQAAAELRPKGSVNQKDAGPGVKPPPGKYSQEATGYFDARGDQSNAGWYSNASYEKWNPATTTSNQESGWHWENGWETPTKKGDTSGGAATSGTAGAPTQTKKDTSCGAASSVTVGGAPL